MTELADVPWPPTPIRTARLLLRETEARDRPGFIDLFASDDVRRYLGGARSRSELEEAVPEVPGRYVGTFAVQTEDSFIGAVTINRRDPTRPGHVRADGGEVEVGYTFLPQFWGRGYATEAVGAALEWVTEVLPGEPVVLCTQSANEPSVRLAERLGFAEVERFKEFDAEQWFGVWTKTDLS
ncbi:GNAT family N-acetyltransferase [Kribbella sp. NBC_01510]|uniref:GNAT family N-acetyltransferase n=1 Tax=Kribbella sp. NBC_01510 TaxID=2903581 RepID=UPI00386D13C7